ncbi:MAG TPA: ester cyclase [Streptosporangiaceae bacterium]|nr:ester cyclase [Streptosporangiaceae bacterium]
MSEAEEVLAGIYEAINTGNLTLLDKFVAPGYIEHSEGFQGVEPFKQQISAFRTAFPDLHVSIDDLLADGDRFASRTTITGTHTGDLMGIPATGKRIMIGAVDIGRVGHGQAQERWGGLDMYALLTQLGVIPAPQPS